MARLTNAHSHILINQAIMHSGKEQVLWDGVYSKDVLEEAVELLAAYEDATHAEDGTEILTVEEIAQLAKTKQEGKDYKAQLAEAVELLGLAVKDIHQSCTAKITCENGWEPCPHEFVCKNDDECVNWRWQHADRLEKLREALK